MLTERYFTNLKRPLYLPEDGYNSWRTCKYFELNESVSHYMEKNEQYAVILKRRAMEEQKKEKDKGKVTENKAVNNKKEKSGNFDKTLKKEVKNTYEIGTGYRLIEYIGKFPKTDQLEWQLLNVTMSNRKQKKINVGFDKVHKLAYVDKNMYTQEARECVRRRI